MKTTTDLASQIEQARADVALLARLQGAEKRLPGLEKDYAAALAAQEREAAKQAEIAREASYGGVTDIRVVGKENPQARSNVLATSFDIFYTRPQFSMRLGKSVPTEHKVQGFVALRREAMLYLLEKRPDLIPQPIRELSPDDPHGAMDAYFRALRRGHL